MIQVTRKDKRESLENLIRRFNKKVQSSGVLKVARKKQRFEKEPTRKARREDAIAKRRRREEKIKQTRLGRRR